eukprot:TRINITY_DN566_c1_g3_i1.p1 TRINITY_DN566_c1_g3~~TRINITY_DN566_c1_g3_i1.p1  ORF type:complete len:1717 (-),score=467.09 TRINITY_DN566_c1_g3_i1:143-5293(-)
MAANLPIRFQELLQVPSLGVNPEAISFNTLTMDSDKFICIREQVGEQANVVIIELDKPQQPIKFSINADSAVMNPQTKILALKAGSTLQIFDLGMRRKLKDHVMTDLVIFWKWISPTTLALVTNTAVYHWTSEGTDPPKKVFDRHQSLADAQIINYRADSTQKWLVLIGIASREGRIAGAIQLYSVERGLSQAIEGHAAAFGSWTAPGSSKPSILFSFASRTPSASKLYILEVGGPEDGTGFQKRAVDIYFPPAAGPADFPVAMQISDKYGIIFMITKAGYLYLFDIATGTTIYMNQISAQTIFVTAPHVASNGIIGVNKAGQVLLISIDEANIIPYICNTLKNFELAISLASRANLPGAENLFAEHFNKLFQQGLYKEAAKVAAESPAGVLRTPQTMQRFQNIPAVPGQPLPLLQYFGVLLELGKLNKIESIELARMVISQGRAQYIEKWLQEDKLACSEELGDLVRHADPKLSLQIYYRGEVKHKVVGALAELGQYEKIVAYAKKVSYQPDWAFLLHNLLATNPQSAVAFANMLLTTEGGPLVDINTVVEVFLSRNMIQETTSILWDVLKGNKPEEASLQTLLLEINLVNGFPQVADGILNAEIFTHYNRKHIGTLCERAGLSQRAIEHYTDISDIKRVLVNAAPGTVTPEFLVNFFSTLTAEDTLELLKELLRANPRQYLQVVVQVAVKYSEQLTPTVLIDLFENFKLYEGLYLYLNQIISYSQDPEVHFKFIQAGARTGQYKEVEKICRESNYYDPEKTKNFLKEARLPEQQQLLMSLIIVCDRFDFVNDLTHYLYQNKMMKFIEVYVQKVNPANSPSVVGALLDLDCSEDYIKNLIMSVRTLAPMDELVEQIEKRNRLKILTPLLEARLSEGATDAATHNAIAKIYIDSNHDAEKFLISNPHYDSRVVGKYCENRDPHLSVVAYKRGSCDKELIDVTNKNSLFKAQARYLVERQDPDLWATVLSDQNTYRRSVIDQVIQTALPESKSTEEVSCTVKAFMTADLPSELIELLEKIVIENSQFSTNRNLQNLLILTAIKADTTRVMGYVNRLDNYDAPDIANIAVGSELYEEAFVIFKKFKYYVQAIQVLIDHLDNIARAADFAEQIKEPQVWSKLGRAQLQKHKVKEAVDSFIKANDPELYIDVIAVANEEKLYDDLIRFLIMCRKKPLKEPYIESEIIYAYAKTNKLAELEEFISSPNCAQIQVIGDRCFAEGLYEAAKLLFNNISNFARLASTLVKLGQYGAAVDAARKAKSTRTYKEVNAACVEAKEFRLAQICGLHIIVHADELEELINLYESRGYTEELMSLLESGLGLDGNHNGMFTELAILYSKYKPERLMEHLENFHPRLNTHKVIRICEKNHQWPELTFLYVHDDEYDLAALTMINHSVEAWDHTLFKEVIIKVATLDICYKSIQFYLDTHPSYVNDLLTVISPRIDHARVVNLVKSADKLPLVKPYLLSAQQHNVPAVNEALNGLYIEEEDYEGLKVSIDSHDAYDPIALAGSLENHELLEFRRIAAYLYKKNHKWSQSIELSRRDAIWKDAIQTAADSKSRETCEDLLKYFVEKQRPDCFAAALYTCYEFVRADVALELAWKHKYIDFVMPFMCQTLREYTGKIDELWAASKAKPESQEVSAVGAFPQVVVDPATGQVLAAPESVYGYGAVAAPIGAEVYYPATMSAIPMVPTSGSLYGAAIPKPPTSADAFATGSTFGGF